MTEVDKGLTVCPLDEWYACIDTSTPLIPRQRGTRKDNITLSYMPALFLSRHLTNWFISNMGSKIETTIKPTTSPINSIITGSRSEVIIIIFDCDSFS